MIARLIWVDDPLLFWTSTIMPYQIAFWAVWLIAWAVQSITNGRLRQIGASTARWSTGPDRGEGNVTSISTLIGCVERGWQLRLLGSLHETGESSLEIRARHQDPVGALLAAQADIGPQSHDLPLVGAAGVRLPQAGHIPNVHDHHTWTAWTWRISSTILSAASRAAACQSAPADAYMIARLAFTIASSPRSSVPRRSASPRLPLWAPTPGIRIGSSGASARISAS